MAKTRAAHLSNIDTTGKRIQGASTFRRRAISKEAERAKDKSLTKRWLTDYQRAVEERMAQMRGELGSAIRSGMRAPRHGFRVKRWRRGSAMRWPCAAWRAASPAYSRRRRTTCSRALLDAECPRREKPVPENLEPDGSACREH